MACEKSSRHVSTRVRICIICMKHIAEEISQCRVLIMRACVKSFSHIILFWPQTNYGFIFVYGNNYELSIHHFRRDWLQLFFLSPNSSLCAISSFREFTTKNCSSFLIERVQLVSDIYGNIRVLTHIEWSWCLCLNSLFSFSVRFQIGVCLRMWLATTLSILRVLYYRLYNFFIMDNVIIIV